MLELLKQELEKRKNLSFDEKVEIYNKVSELMAEFMAINHPVLSIKLVKAENLESNDYNPNKVAPPELKLLKKSISKDGLTMPIVATHKNGHYEIIDGFHRNKVIKEDKDIYQSLNGYIPISILNKPYEDRITSTIRHNMARGTHQVELTSELVIKLKKYNWTDEKIGEELGMDADEVLRLKQLTGLAEAFKDEEFSKSWI